MRTDYVKIFCLLSALTLLSACGFALRGSTGIDASLQPVYISGDRNSQELHQALKRQFTINQIAVTQRPSEARLRVDVQLLEAEKRSITLDQEARDAEYALYERARVRLLDAKGQVLRGPRTLQQRRLVVNDSDNPVGEETESSIVQAEMREQLSIRLAQQVEIWAKQLHGDVGDAPAP